MRLPLREVLALLGRYLRPQARWVVALATLVLITIGLRLARGERGGEQHQGCRQGDSLHDHSFPTYRELRKRGADRWIERADDRPGGARDLSGYLRHAAHCVTDAFKKAPSSKGRVVVRDPS